MGKHLLGGDLGLSRGEEHLLKARSGVGEFRGGSIEE